MKFLENLGLIMSIAFFAWLYMRRNSGMVNQYAATANNTAPFWFTAPQNPAPRSFDFATQPNYNE